ncbi:hypothetical protein [Pseudonocardia kongjuensis]|uniref:hypothetical protein n=1 Tax=Pseudonocardia kongjuensis TaxID=102227 RepID=UPI0031DA22A3
MTYLVLVVGGVAVLHAVVVWQLSRVYPARIPGWFHAVWAGLLATVALVAIARSPIPTDTTSALGVLWVVPAVDLVMLLVAVALHGERAGPGAGGPDLDRDRRRLLLGVLATGTATATGVLAARPAPLAAGPGTEGGTPTVIDPVARGARADYTGRLGSPGTGTDSRAGIQAALDAASDLSGTGYFDYVTRRSTTVTLAPGQYLISAPDDDASLVVPPGVVLDAAAATLYFDYPSTARASWCGIRVGQAGQLRLGKLYPSDRSDPPDREPVYDAVRLVQTDDNSRVIGYGDSVIGGWQGAAIRGVGAWLVYVQGLRIADNAYGYVASTTGDGTLGYEVTQVGRQDVRNHADLRIQDCYFVNLTHGGIVGSVGGTAGALVAADHESLNFTVSLSGCAFENIPGYALELTSAMVVATWDCAFEDVGAAGRGMIRLDNCRSASFASTRVNLAAVGDSGRPVPRWLFEVATTESLVVDGMHVFNAADPALQMADAEPRTSWRVGNVGPRNALAPGPVYAANEAFAMSGGWDQGHLVLGTHHLWVDDAGALRHRNGPPGSPTDGEVIA